MIQLFKQLRPRFVALRRVIIPAMCISLFVQILQTLSPLSVGRVIQTFEQKESLDMFWQALWRFALINIGTVIIDWFWWRYFAYIRDSLDVLLNNDYRAKLLKLDHSLIINKGTGRISTMQSKGINAEISLTMAILQIMGIALPRFAFMLTMVAFLTSRVTGALIICAIVTVGLVRCLTQYVKQYRDKVNKAREHTNRITTRVTMEYQTVTLHNMQQYEQSEAIKKSALITRWGLIADALNNLGYQVLYFCFIVVELIIYIVLGQQLLTTGDVTIAQIVVLTQVIWHMRHPISILMQEFSQRNKHVSAYTRWQKFINTPPTIIDGPDEYRYDRGEIVFDKIAFSYPKKKTQDKSKKTIDNKQHDKNVSSVSASPLLQDFSLTIPAGQTTALVGHSGSGKSTLVKLLLRLYDVHSGSIIIDGQRLIDLQRPSRYDHVGYVSQEPAVFDGSIRENLSYGLKEKLSDADLRAALESVHLADIIRAKETGLKTQLGERGIKLSGGERQRLALARLILRDPPIIILDEPTSALDSVSESAITQIFKSRAGHKTIIVIAHRLQTVMHADQIVVLDHGKIAQQGTHVQLIEQDGVYKTLVDLQKGEVKE